MTTEKRIVIIAGPNGAGKTTFARVFLPKEIQCSVFINADLIAQGLAPFQPEAAALRAGRLMIEEIDACSKRGDNFAFETTLSGLSYARRIPGWRADGYHVKLVFLSLPRAETAIARVANRVSSGGHNVPADVIRRRFIAGRKNFDQLYKALVDTWIEYDNSSAPPILVDKGSLE